MTLPPADGKAGLSTKVYGIQANPDTVLKCEKTTEPFGARWSAGNGSREKPLSYRYEGPVPKPTQVVEESILRCSRDSWLRN